jgi:hypothetical protein
MCATSWRTSLTRLRGDLVRHAAREEPAVDRERAARRHLHRVGRPHHQRAEPAHLLLEKPRGLVERIAAQAVRADELRKVARLVHRRLAHRTHLVQIDADAAAGELPRGLTAGEASPHDRHARSHPGRV